MIIKNQHTLSSKHHKLVKLHRNYKCNTVFGGGALSQYLANLITTGRGEEMSPMGMTEPFLNS